MHPFVSYEVARGIVEEARVVSEKGWWFRSRDPVESNQLPSADAEMARLMAIEELAESESVGA